MKHRDDMTNQNIMILIITIGEIVCQRLLSSCQMKQECEAAINSKVRRLPSNLPDEL